jgi:hypothetical protein
MREAEQPEGHQQLRHALLGSVAEPVGVTRVHDNLVVEY